MQRDSIFLEVRIFSIFKLKSPVTIMSDIPVSTAKGGGRVVRRCWVNFRCRGVLLIWITVGQGPIVLAVGAGGGCLDIFSLIYHFCSFSLFLGDGPI